MSGRYFSTRTNCIENNEPIHKPSEQASREANLKSADRQPDRLLTTVEKCKTKNGFN
jgi:hypothetical protein